MKDLKEFVEEFSQSSFMELEIVKGDQALKLKRNQCVVLEDGLEESEDFEDEVCEIPPEEEVLERAILVTSKRVGVFSTNLVAGDMVQVDDRLGFIESMNIKHVVKAENSGQISQVMVESGQGVAFGDPLFELRDDHE